MVFVVIDFPCFIRYKVFAEIRKLGTGECWRSYPTDERMQSFEYEKIVDSHKVMEDIPFEWQELDS